MVSFSSSHPITDNTLKVMKCLKCLGKSKQIKMCILHGLLPWSPSEGLQDRKEYAIFGSSHHRGDDWAEIICDTVTEKWTVWTTASGSRRRGARPEPCSSPASSREQEEKWPYLEAAADEGDRSVLSRNTT